MILLEPLGGLANRMRVIASGIRLMKETNQELNVIWNLDEELNCDFNVLFKAIPNITFISKDKKFLYLHRSNQVKLHKRIKAYLRNKLLGIDYFITEGDLKNHAFRNKFKKIVQNKRNVFISTNQEFGASYLEYKNFIPTIPIQEVINRQKKLFAVNTIGIHIRQTDNYIAIKESPLSLFIDQIKAEFKKDSNTTFFLATDDPLVENELIHLFGDKIIVYKKELSRASQKGIVDAVVDMYCLSETKLIYGSYWTSFSDVASIIGNIEKKILKND